MLGQVSLAVHGLALFDHHGLLLVQQELRRRPVFLLILQFQHTRFFTNLLRFSLLFGFIIGVMTLSSVDYSARGVRISGHAVLAIAAHRPNRRRSHGNLVNLHSWSRERTYLLIFIFVRMRTTLLLVLDRVHFN